MTAALSGVTSINVLGWKQKYEHRKRPFWILQWLDAAQKATTTRGGDPSRGAASIAYVDPWDVVMFADGSDTAFTGVNASTIVARLHRSKWGTAGAPFRGRRANPDISTDDRADWEARAEKRQQFVDGGGGRPAPGGDGERHDSGHGGVVEVPFYFSAEANCYHQQSFSGSWAVKKGRCLAAYKRYDPTMRSKWRYLNAGSWVGYAWAVRLVMAQATSVLQRKSHIWCDQSLFGSLLLADRLRNLVALDADNRFALSTYHFRVERDVCDLSVEDGAAAVQLGNGDGAATGAAVAALSEEQLRRAMDDRDLSEPSRVGLRLCHSRVVPALLHFNGKSEGGRANELLARSVISSLPVGHRSMLLHRQFVTFIVPSKQASGGSGGPSVVQEVERLTSVCPTVIRDHNAVWGGAS